MAWIAASTNRETNKHERRMLKLQICQLELQQAQWQLEIQQAQQHSFMLTGLPTSQSLPQADLGDNILGLDSVPPSQF
jgi:pullulanase/glycogen debranching enzyme